MVQGLTVMRQGRSAASGTLWSWRIDTGDLRPEAAGTSSMATLPGVGACFLRRGDVGDDGGAAGHPS